MADVTVAAPSAAAQVDTRLPSMWSAVTPQRAITLAIVLAGMLVLLPVIFGSFWMQVIFQAVVYSAVALGLGLLVGRAGMFSLCQVPLLAAGAWFSLRVADAVSLPFPLLLAVAGVLTGVVGAVIGIPAIRLSGLYLALITLMAAGAITLLLKVNKFPNGGSGFWGFDTSVASGAVRLDRPAWAEGDIAYYRYGVIVVALLFLFVAWHIKGKPGRAWASIRQSQVTAVAAGVDTTLYKLWAFALSAFVTGVAGALLAAGPGGVSVNQFPVEQSIVLLAVVLMGGVYNIWGAVVAGFLLRVLPQILDQKLGLPVEILTILFGVGVMQVLLTAPGGIVSDLTKLGKRLGGLASQTAVPMDGLATGPPTVFGSLGGRFGALIVDGIISQLFVAPGYLLLASDRASIAAGLLVGSAGSIAYLMLYCRMVGRSGQSWGHRAFGVRVVDAQTGDVIGVRRAFGRTVVRAFVAMLCYVGILWAIWEPRKRGWHDMAVGSVVVPATSPFARPVPEAAS